ncbi:MAG: DUF6298 domain-containing protein, partial [Pseudomonadota bacterium]|nr:DUF6298 domain-containing protein [Pseudomonadota bacterium]
GEGQAWDGLSLYDLTRFNPWYFDRTAAFAELCDSHGLVLHHSLHNTHNLLEIVPHWVDYPWRPANNVNDTGLPEPMPIEPRGRIHLATEVYNVDYGPRAALHRGYIRQVLDRIGRAQNLLLGVGFQYSGPLAFQQFFMDTVREWERENRTRVRIALTASKDVTDAILADPVRAQQVAVIDTRYWQYRPDGSLWAPKGGQNKAFREAVTEDFGRMGDHAPATTPAQAYRQVREYRERFPHKAVVAWHNGAGQVPALMAGAAQVLMRNPTAGHDQGRKIDHTPLDGFLRGHLAADLPRMDVAEGLVDGAGPSWALADVRRRTVLVASMSGPQIAVAPQLRTSKLTRGLWFSPKTGTTLDQQALPPLLQKPDPGEWLLLLRLS